MAGFEKVFVILVGTAGAILSSASAVARDPIEVPTQSAAFAAEGLARIDAYYQAKVDRNEMAGVVLLIAHRGKIVHFKATGYADTERRKTLENDSIFRLYSMTKPIAATALMMLYEEGKFQLDEPISKYLAEFKGVRVLRTPTSAISDTVPAIREPTIHDLLRFTEGFVHGLASSQSAVDDAYLKAGVFELDISLAEMTARISKLPLAYQPGYSVGYSVAPDIQARLVEVLSGKPFAAFLKERLFEPLGMADTGFWVEPKSVDRLVSVHWSKDGKIVPMSKRSGYPKPEIFLDEAWSVDSYTKPRANIGGSFGLVSTASDYWRFAQMMANGGTFAGRRFLSPSTVRYMARDHRSFLFEDRAPENASGMSWGLGFAVIVNSAKAGIMSSEGTSFWHGHAATTFWIDPAKDIVVVAMTQHIGSDKADLDSFVPEVRALVYGALSQ